jgi:voltage-gated potassium channel
VAEPLGAFDRIAGRVGLGSGYGLLALDLLALGWVILESFLPQGPVLRAVDFGFGLVLGAELVLRLRASPQPWREITHPAGIADLLAVTAFLLSPFAPGWGFLRSLRTLRLLRSARLAAQLRRDIRLFRVNPDAPIAAADLIVFIVVMTGVVHATQHGSNPQIVTWADALYFTITALTTTGFGDITLQGTGGRLLTVFIMLCGVTLFLRLAQALFRPVKVRFRCPSCGLGRHDTDAVHCKACGVQLNIPDDDD